jgi:sialidase-1
LFAAWALSSGLVAAAESVPTLRTEALFEAGQAGYYCFRIPALVVTNSGSVLAFAEARRTSCADWDEIDLVVRRSEDGKKWSDLQVLSHEAKHSMNQPTPIVDRETGALWLIFCRDNQSVFASHSEDDGVTWSRPRDITKQTKDPTWKYVAAGPGHGIQLSSGRLLLAAWGDASPGPAPWPPIWGEIEFTFAMYSDDHGATWQRGRPMYENATEEGMVVETGQRQVYMALRSLHGRNQRGHAWSDDGGYSWSKIEFDPTVPDPPAHASIHRAPAAGVFLFVNPASVKKRKRLTVRVSQDDCKTWPIARVLYEGSSAYSDLAVAKDDTVLCLFEADQYSKLILARFDMAWLVDKKNVGVR